MLIDQGSYLYVYPITRDFGFAPNPFHGICTLATCKPKIRKGAREGDWIIGVGGSSLKAVARKCIFMMKVSEKMSFQNYWDDPRFVRKRPARNGSRIQMLGDNIYHQDKDGGWLQEDSHHSNQDGSPNLSNVRRDTQTTDQVLISEFFFYFGSDAIDVDLDSIGHHRRIRDFTKTHLDNSIHGKEIIESVSKKHRSFINNVIADPYHFMDSHKRVDQETGNLM
jgi:hypothetical protein